MTLSELIAQAQRELERHGDMPVAVFERRKLDGCGWTGLGVAVSRAVVDHRTPLIDAKIPSTFKPDPKHFLLCP